MSVQQSVRLEPHSRGMVPRESAKAAGLVIGPTKVKHRFLNRHSFVPPEGGGAHFPHSLLVNDLLIQKRL
jgi:hypothetical protein